MANQSNVESNTEYQDLYLNSTEKKKTWEQHMEAGSKAVVLETTYCCAETQKKNK